MKSLLLALCLLFVMYGQTQNTLVSEGLVFDGEPYLAVNPSNSQHIVVAWMAFEPFSSIAIRTRVSMNGGVSWSLGINTPHFSIGFTSADPSLHFDSEGNVYLVYIDSNSEDLGAVYCRKSEDGGYTWSNVAEVISILDDPTQKPIDRPWVAIDNSGGEYDGNIYVTTMNPRSAGYIPPPYNPYLTKSVDGGQTFEDWQHVDGEDWFAGSLILQPMPTPGVSADGTLHVVYPSYVFSQNIYPQYVHAYSTDGGSTFSYQTLFDGTANPIDSLAKKGYLLRCNPSLPDHLAFFYPFAPNGDGDIMMRETFNGGFDWTEEMRVNDDPIGNGNLQDLVWADFDEDGDLVVTWRDRRSAADTGYQVSSEIWGAVRMNGELTFSPNFPISNVAAVHEQVLNGSGNDFMCVEMVDDTINVVWGDVRTGFLKIWFQRLTLNGEFVSLHELNSEWELEYILFPNPCLDRLNIVGRTPDIMRIYDSLGSLKAQYTGANMDETSINVSTLATGKYLLECVNGSSSQTLEFIKK